MENIVDDQIFLILEDQILCPVVGELLRLLTFAARNRMVNDITVRKMTVGVRR